MPREDARTKATRLLEEGRVSILRVDRRGVLAVVRGDTAAFYRVEFDGARWSCSCPAVGPCSHAIAVQRVTVSPGAGIIPELVGGAAAGRDVQPTWIAADNDRMSSVYSVETDSQ